MVLSINVTEWGIEMVTEFDNDTIQNNRKRISINENSIDILKLEVLEYARSCNDSLNKILDIVESTEAFYQSESGKEYRAKFHELSNSFQNIIFNIENIAYGLKEAKNKFINLKDETIAKISIAEANISNK